MDKFMKVAVVIEDTHENLKCWIFKQGLRPYCMFREKLGFKRACSLSDFLNRVQPYMNQEVDTLDDESEKCWVAENPMYIWAPIKDKSLPRDDKERGPENKTSLLHSFEHLKGENLVLMR